jgi:hypothetical protein
LVSHPLPTASGNDQSTATPDQRIGGGPNHETNPIFEVSRQ